MALTTSVVSALLNGELLKFRNAKRALMDRRSEIGMWNELLGGEQLLPFKTASGDGDSATGTYRKNDYSKGVFAQYPASTPKYDTRNDTTETMARMLVPIPGNRERVRFVRSFGEDTEARKLAEALAVTDQTAGPKGNGRFGMGYIDFLLAAAVESHEEKVQVVDVLSDNYVAYYFGEHPPIFQYQGKLLNTEQDDWRNAFSIVYNSIVRGTQLARRRRLVTLTYDNVAVSGTIMGMNQTLTADMEMAADFSFKILVKRFDVYRRPGVTFNPPSGFPSNVVDPSTFGNLNIKRVSKTLRTVGTPQYVTSEPEKTKEETEEEGRGLSFDIADAVVRTPDLAPTNLANKAKEEQEQKTIYKYAPTLDVGILG